MAEVSSLPAPPDLADGLDEYEAQLEQTLAALREFRRLVHPSGAAAARTAVQRPTHVSDTKLALVREYVQAKQTVRQSDVARDLDMNTGSVSVALNTLEDVGEVSQTGRRVQRSKEWEWTGAPKENGRATVIEPGEGVREGRKKVPGLELRQ